MLKDVNLKIAQLKIMATREVHSCSNCGKKDKFKNDPHETCSTLFTTRFRRFSNVQNMLQYAHFRCNSRNCTQKLS
jgi:hypothetical protein